MSVRDAESTAYEKDGFVNRETETKTAENFIKGIINLDKDKNINEDTRRVLAFHGERGAGKSWLAFHLHRTLLPDSLPADFQSESAESPSVLTSFLIACQPLDNEQIDANEFWVSDLSTSHNLQLASENAIADILTAMATEFDAPISPNADNYERSQWLMRALAKRQQKKQEVLILIVDSIFEAPEPLIFELEKYLLVPLLGLSRSGIILTGRGKIPSWQSYELFLATEDIVDLPAFDSEDISRQLEVQTELGRNISGAERNRLAQKVKSLSGGHPLNNRLLAGYLERAAIFGEKLDDKDIAADALELLLNKLFERQPPHIRQSFEALAILDGFLEWDAAPLLETFLGGDYINRPQAVRDVIKEMVDTHLVEYSTENKRYVINGSVLTPLRSYLQFSNKSRWQSLHKAAIDTYERWSKDRPQSAAYFEERADYHREIVDAIPGSDQHTTNQHHELQEVGA